MMIASLRIRRQLGQTPGVLRWASVVAGPREFWTITVWETRDKMLDFMRSGAHEDIMWLFGKWLRSFWLMRWRPTSDEHGAWSGTKLGKEEEQAAGDNQSDGQRKTLQAALDALPYLKAAAGPDGAARYETSPSARRFRKAVAGCSSVIVRLQAPSLLGAPRAWLAMRPLRRALADAPEVLRWVSGVGRPTDFYLLAVMRTDEAAAEFLERPEPRALAERWGDAYWAMRWEPANEFGHWDGFRLRRTRLGTAIPVPEQAMAAARMPGDDPPSK